MDAEKQAHGAAHTSDERVDKNTAHQVVSAARRHILKVGLSTVPVIFTLRSKPVFGQTTTVIPSACLSATHASHGIRQGCI